MSAFHLIARLALLAFCLLTWAYGIACYSPFAFDMFIRPRLLPSLAAFVAWHHLWYWGAYLLSATSLAVGLPPAGEPRRRLARWLVVAYVIVFGTIGVRLVTAPYLPTLGNDVGSLLAALATLGPLLWVAAIDHLAGWSALASSSTGHAGVTGSRRLLVICVSTACYVWLIQAALVPPSSGETAIEWVVGRGWALALSTTTFMIVYLFLNLLSGVAATAAHARAWEFAFLVALMAGGLGEFVRRVVLRAVSFDEHLAIPLSVVTGFATAAVWSGVALRKAASVDVPWQTGLDLLFAPGSRRTIHTIVALLVVPLLMYAAVLRVDRLDWDFVIQKTLIVGMWTVAFALSVRASARVRGQLSARWLIVPPLAALAVLSGLPPAASALASATGGPLQVTAVLDRLVARDVAVRLQARALVRQPGLDRDYYRYLQQSATGSADRSVVPPHVAFSRTAGIAEAKPHVFLLVIDSLRRDYLSLYNPLVDFTPELDRFGRDSLVFTNAFASYGGTWLSMPSLWVGGSVPRGWGGTAFDQVNAVEQLIAGDGYRLAINDYTVAGYLKASTPSTFLDPEVPSVDTDLCRLLTDLETHLDATAADARPVFAYLAPMNVHLLNTRSGKTLTEGEQYPGFYAPYASRLRRLDACLGGFIAYLKQRALYDDSIVIVTSDHGDSLGENGQWGHQFGLFPEHVRVPLVVHLPEVLRSTVTTDLSRVAFLTDLAPTLYALVGHEVADLGPLFGSPLFVPQDREPRPRRRGSFLLTSSYGPTFGLLRRNGRSLYVSDVAAGRDFAFDLARTPLGVRADVTDDVRQLSQRAIRQHLAAVNALHGIATTP